MRRFPFGFHRRQRTSAPVTPRRGARRRGAPLLLAAALGAGCAGIEPFGPQPLQGAAQSAVMGRGQVNVRLEPDGTAIVHGWVDQRLSEMAVLRTVGGRPEVERVVDWIRVDDWYR